jgi:hypothetical protein
MDEIDLEAGGLGDATLVFRHDRLKFLDRAILDPAIDRVGPDVWRKHAHQRVVGSRTLRGGLHHPNEAAGHVSPSVTLLAPMIR